MTAPMGAVVLSTPDPQELAAFYAELLGWSVVTSDPDRVRLGHPDRERPGLTFQREPRDALPTWPAPGGGVPMQAHLDVLVDDLDVEQARAASLGASVETHQPAPGARVVRDPPGHGFCRFLPGS